MKELSNTIARWFPKPSKKCIQDWDFILVFEQYYQHQIQILFSTLKCQQDIEWRIIDNKMQKQVLFVIRMSDQVVKDMAHELKILKIKDKKSYQLKLKEINLLIYTTDKQAHPNIYNYLCFLRARMRPQNKQIYEQQKYSPFNKNKQQKYPKGEDGNLFTCEEQLRAKYHFLLTYSEKIKQNQDQILHVQEKAKQPFRNIMKHPGFIQLVPIQKSSQHPYLIIGSLKQYVGPNTECYFDFVAFLQKWLVFPMIVGLLAIAFNNYYDYTADNSPFDFIYALTIMIWSILFITRWEEIQKWTKVKESQGRSQLWTQSQDMISKELFERKYSKVTGQLEFHLPFKLKLLFGVISNFLCLSMMFLTLVFIVYSLNARGFIDPEHKFFYSEMVSSWAKKGGIFDSQTLWGQIPNIIHVIVTNGFDQNVYRRVVKNLAKLERHENRKGYENSIIFKYFIYEFVITFADLFYIAFVRLDIEGLRQQLLSLFFIDIVRRVIAQSVVPWIKHKKQRYDSLKYLRTENLDKNAKYQSKLMGEDEQLQYGAILQVNKQSYQPFDDYLQIITNMGYLIMISSCFPLAPLLIIIAHQVELIQDRYKIIHIFKRKLPESYVGMGRWKNIIVFICYFSIVTNIMLFAFSSQQVASIFPKMYESGKDLLYGNTDLTTILGGATDVATDFLQNFLNLENSTLLASGIVNMFLPEQQILKTSLPNDILQEKSADTIIEQNINHIEQDQNQCKPQSFDSMSNPNLPPPLIVKQFKPPNKQSELTFMAMLFFIEHFFLLLFIFIRDLLKRRKSEAQIFVQRREYKRRIKKNLPKDILTQLKTTYLVDKMINNHLDIKHKESGDPNQGKLKKNTPSRMTASTNQSEDSEIKKIFLEEGQLKENLKEE